MAVSGLGLLFLLVGGCALWNVAPVARIAASVLTGESPLSVTLDASDSYDPDGQIVAYRWSFGDGATEQGKHVSHIYAPSVRTTYTVTLEIEDDVGAISTIQQSLEVHPAPDPGNNPPSARFTFTPTHGDTPLSVVFDARATRDADGEIEVYAWDFGDGSTGSGSPISHTYTAVADTNYAAVLTVTDDDGASSSTTAIVSVYVQEIVPIDGPTAELAVTDVVKIYDSPQLPGIPSLFDVTFTPDGSTAAAGYEIEHYVWNFGDGESISLGSDAAVTHTYRAGAPSRTFVATLTVIDDQGLRDSAVVNVTVTNN